MITSTQTRSHAIHVILARHETAFKRLQMPVTKVSLWRHVAQPGTYAAIDGVHSSRGSYSLPAASRGFKIENRARIRARFRNTDFSAKCWPRGLHEMIQRLFWYGCHGKTYLDKRDGHSQRRSFLDRAVVDPPWGGSGLD